MNVILGIDAAWTATQPSGVALVASDGNNFWRCLCVAPSYAAFIGQACERGFDWRADTFDGDSPDIPALLSAARRIAGVNPTLVAVDMPLATTPFSRRRRADQAISEAFGGRGCSTHSPNPKRPGPLGTKLMADLSQAGYPLATCSDDAGCPGHKTIEVFPHPALLVLLDRSYRVPYKVGKTAKYWKGASVLERKVNLLGEFDAIHQALREVFGETHVDLPSASTVRSLSQLKRYEDALDALVAAWVGTQFLSGAVSGYGDHNAAIWVPTRPSAV